MTTLTTTAETTKHMESGMIFEGTTGVYEHMSFHFQMKKKESYV